MDGEPPGQDRLITYQLIWNGAARDEIIRKAPQAETGSRMSEGPRSAGGLRFGEATWSSGAKAVFVVIARDSAGALRGRCLYQRVPSVDQQPGHADDQQRKAQHSRYNKTPLDCIHLKTPPERRPI